MKLNQIILSSAILFAISNSGQAAQLISNGGFESGFSGWSRADQAGSDGSFFLQSGATSPLNGFTVAPPPEGTNAAMTDAGGPGTHILYQDFLVTNSPNGYLLTLQLFIANQDSLFRIPNTLAFDTTALNQQFRIDIISTSANLFSVAGADILQNVYLTNANDPLTSGYLGISADLTSILSSRVGQTLRLRFAEVDNVAPMNVGIDSVSIDSVSTTEAPEPSTLAAGVGLLALALIRARRK